MVSLLGVLIKGEGVRNFLKCKFTIKIRKIGFSDVKISVLRKNPKGSYLNNGYLRAWLFKSERLIIFFIILRLSIFLNFTFTTEYIRKNVLAIGKYNCNRRENFPENMSLGGSLPLRRGLFFEHESLTLDKSNNMNHQKTSDHKFE